MILTLAPVSNASSSKLASTASFTSMSPLASRRRKALEEKRGELLINGYEKALRDGPSTLSRPSAMRLSSDDPLDFFRYSVVEPREPPTYDEDGRGRGSRNEFLKRKLNVRKTLPIESGSTKVVVSIKQSHPRAALRERAAVTVQRAYRAHCAFNELQNTGSRVNNILVRTRHNTTTIRIEKLHALIAELGAISAVLDRSPITAGKPRVLETARHAATCVRQALENVENVPGSGCSSSSDESIDTSVLTEPDDEDVWVYAPRVAHVHSCLDLNAADIFDENDIAYSTDATGVLQATGFLAMDVSDSDSEFEELTHACMLAEKEEVKEEVIPVEVSEADCTSDYTFEDFCEDLQQSSPSLSSPEVPFRQSPPPYHRAINNTSRNSQSSFSKTIASCSEAEAQAKERLAALAVFFSSNNRRWAGQPEESFPPPKRTRRRSSCALPPPPSLFVIKESDEE